MWWFLGETWWVLVLIVVIVMGAGVATTVLSGHEANQRARCEVRGGVYFTPRGSAVCLRADVVINVN